MIVVRDPPLLLVTPPGTRGRWVAKVARRMPGAQSIASPCAPAWWIGEDESLAALRAPQLLRAGVVQDPWSWYAETWMAGMRAGGAGLASIRAWGGGSTRFRDVLRGMTHPELRASEPPDPLGVSWHPVYDGGYAALVASTLGLASFTLLYHLSECSAWRVPTERPAFVVDVLADGNQPGELARVLCNITDAAVLPPLPGPPPAVREAVRLGYDSEMLGWVAEADRPVVTAMRYGPFTAAGIGALFPVRQQGARRKEPVVPRPAGEVEARDRDLVARFRAASARRPAGEDAPVLPTGLSRLQRWVDRPA